MNEYKTKLIGTLFKIALYSVINKMINNNDNLKEGDTCTVIQGTHKGKSGVALDLNISKTGHVTLTVKQPNCDRFKTLARNVRIDK